MQVLVPVGAIVGLSLHAMEAVGDVALAWLQHLLQATPTGSLLPTAISLSDVADAAAGGVGEGGLDAALLTDLGWAAVNVFMLGWFLALNQVSLEPAGLRPHSRESKAKAVWCGVGDA